MVKEKDYSCFVFAKSGNIYYYSKDGKYLLTVWFKGKEAVIEYRILKSGDMLAVTPITREEFFAAYQSAIAIISL